MIPSGLAGPARDGFQHRRNIRTSCDSIATTVARSTLSMLKTYARRRRPAYGEVGSKPIRGAHLDFLIPVGPTSVWEIESNSGGNRFVGVTSSPGR